MQVRNNLFATEAILTDWSAEKPEDQAKLQVRPTSPSPWPFYSFLEAIRWLAGWAAKKAHE